MAGNGAYRLKGGTFRWLVHRLEDLAGFNEDSLFSEFAENAFHVVFPTQKRAEQDGPVQRRTTKIKATRPRGSAIFSETRNPPLFC